MTIDNPPIDPPKIGSVHKHSITFKQVEERMVEAMRLWRRSPGGGGWPFAGDGPWHLVRDDGSWQAEWDHRANAHRQGYQEKPRALPLSVEEVAERDRVSEWLRFVPERDRRLVVLALVQLASGAPHPKWSRIRLQLKEEIGARGLGQRYSRAITAIVRRLGMAENLPYGVSSPMVNADENKGCSP